MPAQTVPESNFEQSLSALEFDQNLEVVEVLKQDATSSTEVVRAPSGQLMVRKYVDEHSSSVQNYIALRGKQLPNLPRVFNVYPLGNKVVVLMEYLRGMTLREYVQTTGPLSPGQAVALLQQVCEGIHFLHTSQATPIIHRDINPNNIIISGGRALLVDLGISRTYDAHQSKDTQPLGTFGYAAPEQYGFAQTDVRSDVYALGATYYFMLTGHDPEANIPGELADANLPAGARRAIEQACAYSPSERFNSVREFLAQIPSASQGNLPKPQNTGIVRTVPSILLKVVCALAVLFICIGVANGLQDVFTALAPDQAIPYVVLSVLMAFFALVVPTVAIAFIPEYVAKHGPFKENRLKRLLIGVAVLMSLTFVVVLLGNALITDETTATMNALEQRKEAP